MKENSMANIRARVVLWLLLTGGWLLLSAPFSVQELIFGMVTAGIIALLPLGGNKLYGEVSLMPKRLIYAVAYLFKFLGAVVKSNLDVAFRVLHPKLPINPGIVKVKTRLSSRMGRLFLANSITLTPGTITVESEGEDLYIHWLNVEDAADQGRDVEENTAKIVGGFEKYLEVIFG